MFWKKKVIVEGVNVQKGIEVKEQVATIPHTIDIFKEYLDSQGEFERTERYHKVHSFMNDEGYKKIFSQSDKDELDLLGFNVFVKADWVKRFSYHATVWVGDKYTNPIAIPPKHSNNSYYDGEYWSRICAQYVGDIPDSVIEKAEKIKEHVMAITVHSMYPLPTEFVKCDPILIGWHYCPCINVHDNGKIFNIYEPDAEGVIIAVWDYDKEFNF
jgi:hypothetical protein